MLTDVTTRLKRGTIPRTALMMPDILTREKMDMPPLIPEKFAYHKCSIGDIFTPYSVNSIGDTANSNFLKIIDNFQKIQKTELRLAHQQKLLATNLKTMAKGELQIARKELFLELALFKSNSLKNFM